MSTALVAGAAAILLSHHPNATPDDVKGALVDGATALAGWSARSRHQGRRPRPAPARLVAALPGGVGRPRHRSLPTACRGRRAAGPTTTGTRRAGRRAAGPRAAGPKPNGRRRAGPTSRGSRRAGRVAVDCESVDGLALDLEPMDGVGMAGAELGLTPPRAAGVSSAGWPRHRRPNRGRRRLRDVGAGPGTPIGRPSPSPRSPSHSQLRARSTCRSSCAGTTSPSRSPKRYLSSASSSSGPIGLAHRGRSR